MKYKTDAISMLIFQNLQITQILEAASLILHPSSEDPNGAPARYRLEYNSQNIHFLKPLESG